MTFASSKSRFLTLGAAAVVASTTLFNPAPARADKAGTLKTAAVGLGVLGAALISKDKPAAGVAALAGGYLLYKEGRKADRQDNCDDRYSYGGGYQPTCDDDRRGGYYGGGSYYGGGGYDGGYYNGGGYYNNGGYSGGGYYKGDGYGRGDWNRDNRDWNRDHRDWDRERRDNDRDWRDHNDRDHRGDGNRNDGNGWSDRARDHIKNDRDERNNRNDRDNRDRNDGGRHADDRNNDRLNRPYYR